MRFGRHGISSANPILRRFAAGFALLLVQALPVFGQDPHDGNARGSERLAFKATPDLSREGYASLSWNEVRGAASYRIVDPAGQVLYSGSLPEFFISGLSDGDHAFDVVAFDSAGNEIARSVRPAVVSVRHWPLAYALTAFSVGLIVMIFVVAVIVRGHRSVRRDVDGVAVA